MARLLCISDLHVANPRNRAFVERIEPSPDDWLVVAGDVGETVAHVEWALGLLRGRFRQLVWVPGNHELWTVPADPVDLRGEDRYRHLVDVCRRLGVLTPEDPYPVVEAGGREVVVAPIFCLYDYSFRRDGLGRGEALERAWRAGVVCTDEFLLHPDPHPSRDAWCRARVDVTAARLAAVPDRYPTVLVSHFPLRQDVVQLPAMPDFALWCGTRMTEDWHCRFRAAAVVSGHLHTPGVRWRDGVRFEEVSLGYAQQWTRRAGGPDVPRDVLPVPAAS
jgi:3',5'-cyclic AMP phosphodiesterase CpdA